MTLYRSTAPDAIQRARLAAAAHIIDSPTGRCRECTEPWPCLGHLEAARTLNRYGHLPRRMPGATRPELVEKATAGESFWTLTHLRPAAGTRVHEATSHASAPG